MLTHATFEVVAAVLRGLPDGLMLPQEVRNAFADAFAASNPRFDRERFLKAAQKPQAAPKTAPKAKAAPRLPRRPTAAPGCPTGFYMGLGCLGCPKSPSCPYGCPTASAAAPRLLCKNRITEPRP